VVPYLQDFQPECYTHFSSPHACFTPRASYPFHFAPLTISAAFPSRPPQRPALTVLRTAVVSFALCDRKMCTHIKHPGTRHMKGKERMFLFTNYVHSLPSLLLCCYQFICSTSFLFSPFRVRSVCLNNCNYPSIPDFRINGWN
jgi:hypothetical protein